MEDDFMLVLQGPGPAKVARMFNRSGDWLRGLERAGIIPPAPRDFAGYRVYPPEYLAEIRRIILSRGRQPEGGQAA